MEQQEIVVSDDSSESSTQDETQINDEKDEKFTQINKIVVSSNPFYNLIERQAKEFEEFGKRMSLGLQHTYKEYEKGGTKVGIDSIGMEKIYKKFEEKFASQSKLIDSLKSRIEELESDSVTKGQKIKKLESEFSNFKGNRSVPPARDNKKESVYSDKNENEKNLETQRPDGKQKQNVKISKPKILKPVVKMPVQNQDNISTTTDDKDENEDDDMFVYRDTFNANTNKNKNTESYDNESFEYNGKDRRAGDDGEHEEYYGNYAGPPTIYFQYNEDDYDDDYEEKGNHSNPSTSYQQYSEYNDENYNDNYSYYGNSQHSQQYEQFEQYDEREGNEQQGIYYNSQGANSNNNNNNNNNQQDSSNRRRPPRGNRSSRQRKSVIHRIHYEIVEQKNAKHLLNKFSVKQLLEFERSHLFRSLGSEDQNSLRNTVNDGLRIELTGHRKLTQPVEVYVHRRLIPPLPSGISSYAEFKTTNQYHALPNDKKKRLQKIN